MPRGISPSVTKTLVGQPKAQESAFHEVITSSEGGMKYHFANAAEPLKEGSTLKAVCGKEVTKATFRAYLDSDVVGYSFALGAINLCRRCNDSVVDKRFLYVICNGQESMTEVSA